MLHKSGILIMLSIVALGSLFTVACGANSPSVATAVPTRTVRESQPLPTPTPSSAPTPIAPRAALPSRAKVVGNLISTSQATLAFQVGGRVKDLPAPEGTRVKGGTLVAALDTTLLELQVAQAQASFDLATANWNRIKAGPTVDDVAIAKSNLDKAKAAVVQAQSAFDRIGGSSNPFIGLTPQALNLQQATLTYQAAVATYNLTVNHPTTSERDAGLAQVAQAQAALDLAKQNLNNAKIVAPFDGTVISIVPKVGESVSSSAPVLTIADLSQMQVLANVDETTLAGLKIGQTATIGVDAIGDKILTGRIKKIGFLATSSGSIVSMPVWIDIDRTDALIYPGLSATVEITTNP